MSANEIFPLNANRAYDDAYETLGASVPSVFTDEQKEKIDAGHESSRDLKFNKAQIERNKIAPKQLAYYKTKRKLYNFGKEARVAFQDMIDNPPRDPVSSENSQESETPEISEFEKIKAEHTEIKQLDDLAKSLLTNIGLVEQQILATIARSFNRRKARLERETLKEQLDSLEDQYEAVSNSVATLIANKLSEQTPNESDTTNTTQQSIREEIKIRQRELDALPDADSRGRSYYQAEISQLEQELNQLSSQGSGNNETIQTPELQTQKTNALNLLRQIDDLRLQRDVALNTKLSIDNKKIINSAVKSQIIELERQLAEIYPDLKSSDSLSTFCIQDKLYLAEISGDTQTAREVRLQHSKLKDKEPAELHADIKKIVDQLSTDSFEAFQNSILEKKYGKGVLGKINNFLAQERNFIGKDGPAKSEAWKVLLRAGGRVITDKKLLSALGITAALGVLTGGFGAVGVGIATSKVILGTGVGRGLSEAWANLKGEESEVYEKLIKSEYNHYLELKELAKKISLEDYSSTDERNAIIKQLLDIYHLSDSGETSKIVKGRRDLQSETTEKWDKVRNKWTNVGAIAGAGAGIVQNIEWLKQVAHRIDLSGDGIMHAVRHVGRGFEHIFGHAFADQYGDFHANVAGETIGKAGQIGHRLLESNRQIYWAMTRSVAPNLLKTASVLAGALIPRIQTHHKPSSIELKSSQLHHNELYNNAKLDSGVLSPSTPGSDIKPLDATPTEQKSAHEKAASIDTEVKPESKVRTVEDLQKHWQFEFIRLHKGGVPKIGEVWVKFDQDNKIIDQIKINDVIWDDPETPQIVYLKPITDTHLLRRIYVPIKDFAKDWEAVVEGEAPKHEEKKSVERATSTESTLESKADELDKFFQENSNKNFEIEIFKDENGKIKVGRHGVQRDYPIFIDLETGNLPERFKDLAKNKSEKINVQFDRIEIKEGNKGKYLQIIVKEIPVEAVKKN